MPDSDPTYEQAKRCPRCNYPGEVVSSTPAPPDKAKPGTKIQNVMCRTPSCRWFNTTWIIQINPDGSIPVRPEGAKEGSFKDLPKPTNEIEERVLASLQRQVEAETQPGSEVAPPRTRGGL